MRLTMLVGVAALAGLLIAGCDGARGESLDLKKAAEPAPGAQNMNGATVQEATFGGGCFWCLDAIFVRVKGVDRVVSGYAGGTSPNPSYEQVCSGATGHAEVIQVRFDPAVIDYKTLMTIFFGMHDPTTRNRQGADAGTQYRSVILYNSPEQKATAEALIRELDVAGTFGNPIVTEVVPLKAFYSAEEYHQDYFRKNPGQGYCQIVISPKMSKLRHSFADRLKPE